MPSPKHARPVLMAAALGTGFLSIAGTASASLINLAPTQDATVAQRDGNAWETTNYGTGSSLDVHQESSGGINFFAYIQFDLSSLNIDTISSATLTLARISPNPDEGGSTRFSGDGNWATDRVDIYGLNNVAGNTAQNWSESAITFSTTGSEVTDASAKTSDPFNVAGGRAVDFSTLNTIGNNDSAAGTDTSTLTGSELVSFLQARADDNGLVTFMVDTASAASMGIYSKEGAAAANLPTVAPTLRLEYSAVPEPAAMALLGAGLLPLVRRRRRA